MPKPNVLVVSPPDLYALRNLDPIRNLANIQIGNSPEIAEEFGPEAEIVLYSGLSGKTLPITEVWPYLKQVRWLHSLSAGVDKLLFPELIESDVTVTNARGVFKRSLAEFVILGVLYFYKRVRRLVDSQRAHKWDDFSVEWMPDRIMGVVGYGEIGRECAILAKALGMKIYATRRNSHLSEKDPVLDKVFPVSSLKSMLSQVDVVVMAAPLTPETHHILSDAELAVMKPSALVMNVGRGPIIDEQALVRALESGNIAGAALDVFEEEPLPASHPFWDMENVLISPHCTDRTRDPDWLDLAMRIFIENFGRFTRGEGLINQVNKRAGY
jgi:phosphoglycerate dehydrogenase-like enzyme